MPGHHRKRRSFNSKAMAVSVLRRMAEQLPTCFRALAITDLL
jgi:hypothetical protein